MLLRPIDDTRHDDAIALLTEGFPARSKEQWEGIFRRHTQVRDPASRWPLGYIMAVKGEDVGVLVTTASSRARRDGTRFEIVNLSSWYIRSSHRLLALKMLKSAVGEDDTVFTDITPIPSVQKMNTLLGFKMENEGVRIYPLPLAALRPSSGARVIASRTPPERGVAEDAARIVADHAALGCVTGWLQFVDDTRIVPLVFCRTDRRGIPGLRLIYGPDKVTVARSAGAISRFLAKRRPVPFWELNANRDDVLPGSFYWNRASPCQIRGRRDGDAIDYAYCESVFV